MCYFLHYYYIVFVPDTKTILTKTTLNLSRGLSSSLLYGILDFFLHPISRYISHKLVNLHHIEAAVLFGQKQIVLL